MKRSKTNKKNRNKIPVISLPILILTGVLLLLNPDWRYWLTADLGRNNISMESSTIPLVELSMEELLEKENVVFDQSLMLINTEYMLAESFVAETGEYKDSGVDMNVCILDEYGELSAAVLKQTGDKLYVSSGIRDRKRQQELYEEDPETATVPGASEHETGLCMDVYVAYFAGDRFLKSEAGQFVNSHCHEYGFIIRYPNYGEKETGIRFEPWHIRYVGQPHADIIYNNKLTLEEYILHLKEGVCYETGMYYIIRQKEKDGKLLVPTGCESYIISPDNTGGYIVTGTKEIAKVRYLETSRGIDKGHPPFLSRG